MKQSEALLLAQIRAAVKDDTPRRVRQAAQLSLAEVGNVCGVDQSTVHRWERGLRSPRGAAGVKYARFIDKLQQTTGVAS